MQVTLLEAGDELGGAIRRIELDGVVVDAGARELRDQGRPVCGHWSRSWGWPTVSSPLGRAVHGSPASRVWVRRRCRSAGILGIPANPFQDDVRRILWLVPVSGAPTSTGCVPRSRSATS